MLLASNLASYLHPQHHQNLEGYHYFPLQSITVNIDTANLPLAYNSAADLSIVFVVDDFDEPKYSQPTSTIS